MKDFIRKKVSIGIPVFNEEKNIGKLLSCLNESAFNFDLREILIVCSGCTDNSVKIVESLMKKRKKIRLMIEKTRKGKFSAVNKILKYSKGDYIIFVNADTIPKRDALNRLIQAFDRYPNVGVVTGRPLPSQSEVTIVGYFQNLTWDFHHEVSLSFNKISGELCALRKGSIAEIPARIINDDGYFTAKILKNYNIIYEPRAETTMIENLNFRSYMKKRQRIAEGFMQLSKLGFDVSVPLPLLLKIIVRRIIKEPYRVFHIILAVMIEIYCNILAFCSLQRGAIDYKWEH